MDKKNGVKISQTALSKADYLAHPARNYMAILSLLLTTILITSIFTTGFSLVRTYKTFTKAAPGPCSDGYLLGTRKQFEEISSRKDVAWISFVRECSTAPVHNQELSGA